MEIIELRKNISFKTVLSKLDRSRYKCLIFTEKGKLVGTLTDGDVRRGLLKGINLSDRIHKYLNLKPFYITKKNYSKNYKKIKNILMRKSKENIDVIPIISKQKKVIKIITKDNFLNEKMKNKEITTPVIVMAGGKGIRLKPFTNFFPKILMPYSSTVAGDHIINHFKKYKFNKFFISVNYKKELIKSYFSKNKNIKFIEEKKFLGTIGSLSLLDNERFKNIICTNCDTIINSNISKILENHIKLKNDITVVVAPKGFKIPYGHFKTGGKKKSITFVEKPVNTHLANVGFYIIKKDIIKLIPKNKRYDINDLFKNNFFQKKKVGIFPISEDNWIDIGSFERKKHDL